MIKLLLKEIQRYTRKGSFILSIAEFIKQITENPILLASTLLTLGVIFFNGVTDATNAIATCVATRAISPKAAVIMSAGFNMLGVVVMTLISAGVSETISNLVNFSVGGEDGTKHALLALCAALSSIIVWSAMAVKLGMPTSESHALVAGLVGASVALHNGFGGINGAELLKVLYGLVLSVVAGFILGFLVAKLVAFIFRKADRRNTTGFFRGAQIFGGAAMSFMHGAQDGQKFMGVMILGVVISKGATTADIKPALWMMLLCSVMMAIGTSAGGYKIIKSVGMDMVKLEPYQGFSADLAGAICLLLSSLLGFPVSTTHTKTTAIMGVGATKRLSAINFGVVKDMALTWVLVFPGCGLIGFALTKLLILIF